MSMQTPEPLNNITIPISKKDVDLAQVLSLELQCSRNAVFRRAIREGLPLISPKVTK